MSAPTENRSQWDPRAEIGIEPALKDPWYGATFGQALKRYVQKALHFRGYASRAEFWWVQPVLFITNVCLVAFLRNVVWNSAGGNVAVWALRITALMVVWLIQIAMLVAQLSLIWRRLHDTGRSGACFFITFVPVIGPVITAVLLALPAKPAGRRGEWSDIDEYVVGWLG